MKNIERTLGTLFKKVLICGDVLKDKEQLEFF